MNVRQHKGHYVVSRASHSVGDWLWALGIQLDARHIAKHGPTSRKSLGWRLAWFVYKRGMK